MFHQVARDAMEKRDENRSSALDVDTKLTTFFRHEGPTRRDRRKETKDVIEILLMPLTSLCQIIYDMF